MDQIKVGKFIAELRHSADMTQEELGERLGVTNKTISRWENGNYMPGIEMLAELSRLFDVSINEIISGQRLSGEEFRENADKNLVSAMSSVFGIKERLTFFRKKWVRDHLLTVIAVAAAAVGIFVFGIMRNIAPICAASPLLWIVLCCIFRNRMMIYAEKHVYGELEASHETDK